jgi:hypothetical protein
VGYACAYERVCWHACVRALGMRAHVCRHACAFESGCVMVCGHEPASYLYLLEVQQQRGTPGGLTCVQLVICHVEVPRLVGATSCLSSAWCSRKLDLSVELSVFLRVF